MQEITAIEIELRHIGIIRISDVIIDDIVSIDKCDTQGQLRDKNVFAYVQKRLLLPESYTVQAMFYHDCTSTWHIFVESVAIPLVKEGNYYPDIELLYSRNQDGTIYLASIKAKTTQGLLTLDEMLRMEKHS